MSFKHHNKQIMIWALNGQVMGFLCLMICDLRSIENSLDRSKLWKIQILESASFLFLYTEYQHIEYCLIVSIDFVIYILTNLCSYDCQHIYTHIEPNTQDLRRLDTVYNLSKRWPICLPPLELSILLCNVQHKRTCPHQPRTLIQQRTHL